MGKRIAKDILEYAQDYLPTGLIIGISGMCIFLICATIWYRKKGIQFWYWAALCQSIIFGMFSAYIYVVLGITLMSRKEYSSNVLDLKMFNTFQNTISSKIFILENILLFVPLGIFVYLIFRCLRRWHKVLGVSLVCSLSIETAQRITGKGKFEIDDIMTNVFGAMLGFLCAWGIYKLYSLYKSSR